MEMKPNDRLPVQTVSSVKPQRVAWQAVAQRNPMHRIGSEVLHFHFVNFVNEIDALDWV